MRRIHLKHRGGGGEANRGPRRTECRERSNVKKGGDADYLGIGGSGTTVYKHTAFSNRYRQKDWGREETRTLAITKKGEEREKPGRTCEKKLTAAAINRERGRGKESRAAKKARGKLHR